MQNSCLGRGSAESSLRCSVSDFEQQPCVAAEEGSPCLAVHKQNYTLWKLYKMTRDICVQGEERYVWVAPGPGKQQKVSSEIWKLHWREGKESNKVAWEERTFCCDM